MPVALPSSPVQSVLQKIITAGLQAADPCDALLRHVSLVGNTLQIGRKRYDLRQYERIIAVGAGKASARMAQGLERVLGTKLNEGFVVVKTGHRVRTRRVTIVEAGHPIPDHAGIQAARRVQEIFAGLTARDLAIVLLSGGASSLLPAPAAGVSLADKRKATQLLLASGATIQEVNIVRKHLSRLKGGGLAVSTKATIATLILSDVIGDDLASIGSGPTAADPTTFAEAIALLRRYKLWHHIPQSVHDYLLKGRRGAVPETLKPGARRLRHVHHAIIGNNRMMLNAVNDAAREAGLRTVLLTDALTGEARDEARRFASRARQPASGTLLLRRPCCVVAGGETTVTGTGGRKGGRAQEFAASAAIEIAGLSNVWVAAVGTDGTDGPTDVAGAIVNGDTVAQARKIGIDLLRVLRRHDTYSAFKTLRCHIHTGPTGTNVNDLYLLLLL